MRINHFAVVAAAIATFVIGGLWYSPLLFHKAWMDANGLNESELKKTGMGKSFGLSFRRTTSRRSWLLRIRRYCGERLQVRSQVLAGLD